MRRIGLSFGLAVAVAAMGIRAEMTYFAHAGQIKSVALIGSGKQLDTGSVGAIDSMGDKKYGGSWNIEFCGELVVSQGGKYEFSLTSDDGSALYMNNQMLIMNDGLHGDVNRKESRELAAGKYQMNLLYFNYIGGHKLKMTVKGPDGKEVDLATMCTPNAKRIDLAELRAEARKREAAERLSALSEISTPEALVRSITHIMKTKPRQYRSGRAYLKQAQEYVKSLPEIIEKHKQGDAEATKALAEFADFKYKALVLDNPYVDFDEVMLVMTDKVALKANWLGTHVIGKRGYDNKIARLNLRSGKVSDVFKPEKGAYVGELDLHFEGEKLLFTSVDKDDVFQVMEVGVDGSNLRQVSTITGQYVHNYGGVYLPSEKIVFSSTAPMIGVPCIGGSTTVPNLYLMNADGSGTRQLTFEQDADWYPTVREDGQVMYLRWEYTDIMHYYSRIMMTMNPDGTNQRAIYGSQSLWPNSMFYARPIPGAPGQFAAIVTGHHGVSASGKLTIFDTNKGYAHADGVVQHIPGYGKKVTHVTVDQLYPRVKAELLEQFPDLQEICDKLIEEHMKDRHNKDKDYHDLNNDFFNRCYPRLRNHYPEMALDLDELVNGVTPQFLQPYPLSPNYFLTVAKLTGSSDWALYLVDTFDNMIELSNPDEGSYTYMIEPYPMKKRVRPPVIPDKVNLQDKQAVCYVQNVYRGPGLRGVPEGTIESMRVFTYAYGYYNIGNHDHIGVESGWDIKRLLGTVKVEKDGSAMFHIPANTTISLQPLDKEGRAVQLFRSWLVAMPGEKLSCIGCHESPQEPPVTTKTIASGMPPQEIVPHRGEVEGYSFEMEIQPVLDAYCVRCHDGSDDSKPNFKNTELADEKNVTHRFSHAYHAFHRYFRRPGPESSGVMLTPYEFHASTSEGVQLLEKGHYGVKLDDESWRRIYTWVDLNVPFHGNWTSVYSVNQGRHQWTTNIAAHAATLRAQYANVEDDWEVVPAQPYPVKVSSERGEELAAPVNVKIKGWPFDEATAKALQQKAGTEKRVLDLGKGMKINLVRIPAGEFVMGSDSETPQEQPRHKVVIRKAFWMSESEINNELFFAFKPDHDAGVFDQQWKDHVRLGYYANYSEQPAVRVSWQDANAFCSWVSKRAKVKAALPTEAQWEWACRAGSESAMNFGSVADDFSSFANLADKSLERYAVNGVNPTFRQNLVGNRVFDFVPRIREFDDGQFLVTGTKQYKPNAWGLYDMHGNVAEWTRSDYVRYPYSEKKSDSMSATTHKVVRGGSFYDRPYRATSSYRLAYQPWQGVHNVGFRIVIED